MKQAGRTEFELKFTGAPGALALLPAGAFFAAIAPDGAWERLTSTYYDTPDRVLATRGLSLRLREEGAVLVQAVKARGPNAASRMEYGVQIEDAAAFPAPTGEASIDALIARFGTALAPLARTSVDRWAGEVRTAGARIELAVDVGQMQSWDGQGRASAAPLAEVELELISGAQAAVFALARLLADNAPLRLGSGTKLGAALSLQRPAGEVLKAEKPDLSGDMSAADALAQALDLAVGRLAGLQSAVIDWRAPAGVHQMRVALRRLRSIERIYRSKARSPELRALAARAKIYARILGAARDWDVFLGETLSTALANDYPAPGMGALKAGAERARAKAWSGVVEALSARAFTQFLLDLGEAATLCAWRADMAKSLERPVAEFAPKALDRALARAAKTASGVSGADALDGRHPLRIALKKLRYPVQLFKELYPKAARADYMEALSALQDDFGAVNDAVVTQRLADEAARGSSGFGGADAAMRVAGFIAGYKAAEAQLAVKNIDEGWRAFEKMRPFWK